MYFTETQDNLFLMGRTIRKVMGGGGGAGVDPKQKKNPASENQGKKSSRFVR